MNNTYKRYAGALAVAGALLLPLGVALADTAAFSMVIPSSSADGTAETLRWNSDIPVSSQAEFGTSTDYGTYSAMDTNVMTNHSLTVYNLTPQALYHFRVIGLEAGGARSVSLDQTFTTGGSRATSTNTANTATSTNTTGTPVVSSVVVTPDTNGTGATVAWTTDATTGSQIQYGTTNAYGLSTSNSAMNTNHSMALLGLTPGTMYHYRIVFTDASGNVVNGEDRTFTTATVAGGGSTATTTAPTTSDLPAQFQQLLQLLEQQINLLRQQIATLLAANGSSGGGTIFPQVPVGTITGGPLSVTAGNSSVRAGSSVNFGGRNFGSEESVSIMLNGAQVGTAHADGSGNFSTGSMSAPTTPGMYVYTLKGAVSGATGTVTINVTQ